MDMDDFLFMCAVMDDHFFNDQEDPDWVEDFGNDCEEDEDEYEDDEDEYDTF